VSLSSGTARPYEIVSPSVRRHGRSVSRAATRVSIAPWPSRSWPSQLSSDPVRQAALRARSPKTISSLNHPHICVLYDVGHQDGMDYLVMECLEGETLAKRLEKGPLSLEQVLKFGGQMRRRARQSAPRRRRAP